MDKARSNPLVTPSPPSESRLGASTPPGQTRPNVAERRSAVRYPISAAAVVIDARSRTKLSGRAADLKSSGCYLDAINLFPVGAAVLLRLSAEARSFECEARVSYSMPGMGMGLTFTKVSADQAAALRSWIAELSGEPTTPVSIADTQQTRETVEVQRPGNSELPFASELRDVVCELITLLRRKGIIADSEAEALRRRISG